MGLHSIGFSYLRESHAPSETFAGQMPFGVGSSGVRSQRCRCWPCLPPRSRSCSIGTEPQRRGPICWFCMALVWTSAIKVSLAPTFGHTCQMLREFDSLCDLCVLAPVTPTRRIIDNCAHPAYRDALHPPSLSAVAPAVRRTRHPFAVSGPKANRADYAG